MYKTQDTSGGPYVNLDSKVRQKKSDFQANCELYLDFLYRFKSNATKKSDFQANYEL